MSDLKQGTRVFFEVNEELKGYGKIVGKALNDMPFVGGTYIIEPEQPLPDHETYSYSHFVLQEIYFKVVNYVTNNGLENQEFDEIRNGLSDDSEILQNIINSQTGHLGDIISAIETLRSLLLIKANKLRGVFENQKLKL